jgi:energy-coupling factor transport system permease protein
LLIAVGAAAMVQQGHAAPPGSAQGPQTAAVLAQFGDGSYVTRCVWFGDESLDGLELLTRSGLEVSVWGAAVCRIEGEGCDYPAERCFCQCLASPCRFWSYWQWSDGRWVYSQVGASQRAVRDGDIDAWVWGDGQSPPTALPEPAVCPSGATPTPTGSGRETDDASRTGAGRAAPTQEYVGFGLMAAAVACSAWAARLRSAQQRAQALHSLTWVAWLAAAAFLALQNAQPLHSVLVVLAAGAVYDQVSRGHARRGGWSSFLRLGLWVWAVALAFNVLSVHAGDIVLFALPGRWPVIGGPITLEALLYGTASGASLCAVLLVFATFNLGVEAHRLLRWIPSGLYQAGLVVSIATSFVPQMMASLKDIREAQQVRGHAFRGLRSLIPLFVPLVTTGLERSLALAESMEARGFGGIVREEARAAGSWPRASALAGLLAALVAVLWRALNRQPAWHSLVWFALAAALTLASVYGRGKQVQRTSYQHERWHGCDAWVIAASGASLLLAIVAGRQNAAAMAYYPYPPFSPWPTFVPAVGLAAALLAVPAFCQSTGEPATEHREEAR